MALEKQTTQHTAHNIDMTPQEFRTLGYQAVDRVTDLLENSMRSEGKSGAILRLRGG